MASENAGNSGDQPETLFSSVAEARAVIERRLCGETVDTDLYRRAVSYLEAGDPTGLFTLAVNATGVLPPDPPQEEIACAEILETLEAYVSLGSSAAERMPEVHRHLDTCRRCRLDLEAARDASVLSAAGKGPTGQGIIDAEKAAPAYGLIQQGEQWLVWTEELEIPLPLDQHEKDTRVPLGPWLLDPAPLETAPMIIPRGLDETASANSSEVLEPITLTAVLPGARTRIQLVVTHTGAQDSARSSWRLSLDIVGVDDLEYLSVRLVKSGDDVREMKVDLSANRQSMVFDVAPLIDQQYQLVFAGITVQGKHFSHPLVIPLTAARNEPNGHTDRT